MFREANEFWKRHLQIQEENKQYGIDTTPIEDTKIEPLNNDVETACTVESSNHILEDVIFMIEPVTVVDGITKPEPPEATKMDFMAAEIDQDTSKPSKEPSNLKQEFPCGECDKGMYIIYVAQINPQTGIIFFSVQNCRWSYRTQIRSA